MKLKKGLPSRNELLICTVKDISPHSAFVLLDEYEDQDAMLHISEVASGRIKNIKDHLQEGKQIVCMTLKVNPQKNYIDVSLKRVRENEKKRKFAEWRLSRRFDRLLGFIGEKMDKGGPEKVEEQILKEYDSLGDFMKTIQRKGVDIIDSLDIGRDWKNELRKEVGAMIARKKVKISKKMELHTHAPDGVLRIRGVFSKALEKFPDVSARYVSAPNYEAFLVTNDYKEGEKRVDSFIELLAELCKKQDITIDAGG